MSDDKNIDNSPERKPLDAEEEGNVAPSSSEVSSIAGSVQTARTPHRVSSSSERQIKFERAQKCLENAALVSKRIKEHRKATAELLGRPFEEDDGGDTASEMASTMSERTGYSAATDTSTTLSVQDALNIPGISESLANTLKQKEILMERIKQYKEISKRPAKTSTYVRKESIDSKLDIKKAADNNDIAHLTNTIKEKENVLSVMQVKMKAMETTILELQERINEKDQIIEAKNMATTLMSETLSKKEKESLELLEDTRTQMQKVQENFIAMEAEWNEEKQRLLKDLDDKNDKILNLEETNKALENSKLELSLTNTKLLEELDIKIQEINKLETALQNLSESNIESSPKEKLDVEEEKGSREIESMTELTKKIELLEQLNCQIRKTNKELENKLATVNTDTKATTGTSPSKKGSPVPTRKTGRNTASKMKSPWSQLSSETLHQETDKKINKNEISRLEMVIQSLNKDILEKEYIISQKQELIFELQSKNLSQVNVEAKGVDLVDIGVGTELIDNEQSKESEKAFEETTEEKIEDTESRLLDVRELEEKLKAANDQISLLNNEIKAANKNMIKEKSTHKLKVKQMQKTIDNFSKMSDNNAEIARLNEELHQLSQKVAELEEEKGNLQLHLVDYDSGRLTESDVYKKMIEMENLAESRLQSISVLETQKFDLVQELHILQQKNNDMEDKLADISQLQSEHVCSEMKSVQLEEQIDQLTASKKELEILIENLKLDKEQSNETIKLLEAEKEELTHKLENYIQENIELTDKLEKLSAEKVSSAESIEIVESLTTQEKLELEEYNKGMEGKVDDDDAGNVSPPNEKNLESLMEQSDDLNKKIELFTQEREEVMAKMNKINIENNLLQDKIMDLTNQCGTLQNNIELMSSEKNRLLDLNAELNHQIEELKRERVEILKETVEMTKPGNVDEPSENMPQETQTDEKTIGDKNASRTKSVKQLTKEILKLKNTIKEREAEIADCQMKILSLEEQQQKQNELLHRISSYEHKLKSLADENNHLKDEIEVLSRNKESEQQMLQYKQANDIMQQDMQKIHQEYSATLNARDTRINELESLLLEYEKQICNYGSTIQQKDKEMAEYINQITKLNDVSQKLRSTIELLEEEKAKDQNAELIKSLNKQMSAFQKKLSDYEKNISLLEDEKSQLLSIKAALESKNATIEAELQKLQEAFNEKQILINELQTQHQKHSEEVSTLIVQNKERDEEIHEIKLQLRKESIENEKLRTTVSEKDKELNELTQVVKETKENFDRITLDKNNLNQEFTAMETKNKELLEKLKKFAVNIKKKASLYTELEIAYHEVQKQLEAKNSQLEQLMIQVETLPVLQDKLKHAEEEINRLQVQKNSLDSQKSQDISQMQAEILSLENKLSQCTNELSITNDSLNGLTQELNAIREENIILKNHVESLSKKIVEYEIDQKNNANFITKISALEADISQKENQIAELMNKFEQQDNVTTQMQFGYDAKIQERDLYIESLEAEISKYKGRICRLEDSVSIMEDRRHSLERKADQLGNQLQEKQKAYSEYTSQEDELVSRLAVLMDHDRVVEKQLYEIDNENKELQNKVQHLIDDNQRLRKSLSDIQDHCNQLMDKASRFDAAESEIVKYQSQKQDLETQLKRITQDYQAVLVQKKKEIEELELEFNTQIESAIKEKKMLSEKYEKVIEHVSQLEFKLQEYRSNIENLNINIEELNRVNEELMMKTTAKESYIAPDYTEQYVSEINKLNSVINSKNQELSELSNKLHMLQTNNSTMISNLESNISDLSAKLNNSSHEIDRLLREQSDLIHNNEELQSLLSQKEEQIKELKETKLTFEMNIPKTEGMVISSTIEPMSDGSKGFDLTTLESQIITDSSEPIVIKEAELQKTSDLKQGSSTVYPESVESIITPKKAYECYKGDDDQPSQESDPFNSDEGWGLGENEDDIVSVTPGLSHLNAKIDQLKKENEVLKCELDNSNAKLMKALRKLKELKSSNDMLTSELKLSKQISQSSFLDSAIEDELRLNIQDLEKKIEELNADLKKEKREKESIKKQNEVFSNANERLTEMKEKLDNEIELWKFKFKEANDKVSTLQWDEGSKITSQAEVNVGRKVTEEQVNDEIVKIEKENEELQTIIDQLTSQNQDLLSGQIQLRNEISELNVKLNQKTSDSYEDYQTLQNNYKELEQSYVNLQKDNEALKDKLEDVQNLLDKVTSECEIIKNDYEKSQIDFENKNSEFLNKYTCLDAEFNSLKQSEAIAKEDLVHLASELETAYSKLRQYEEDKFIEKQSNANIMQDQFSVLESQSSKLTRDLLEAQEKVSQLESNNAELVRQSTDYQDKINDLNSKVENLNSENDNLLSTVAELRSSLSSAVDQRGFEIAELWKQHLAQREADFQKIEHDLRTQLSASEAKYEQLLDNVQSSSQEETNKLIMAEQLTSVQNKLQEKENHLQSLQEKYAEVMNQVHVLRSEMDDEKITHDNRLLEQQEEYEKMIQELTLKNQQNTDAFEQSFKNLKEELSNCKASNDLLSNQNNELSKKISDLEEEILNLKKLIQIKESEIYQKTHDYNITITQRNEEFENVRKQLIEYEKKIEDLTYEKESELAILRLKMHENVNHYEELQKESETEKSNLIDALNAKITECTNLNKQITDLNKTLEEQSSKIAEMQLALENQELEIVSLKDEISTLQNMLKASSSKIQKHVSFASDTKPGDGVKPDMSNELLDAVPKAELDLALYMLHQRDVRCEELTMELTQLLEERDTLQIRLSDSLRSYEELKMKCKPVDSSQLMNISQESVSELPSFSIEREHQFVETHRGQTSRSSSISDPDGERPKLQAKLSELRSVKHSRDVRFRHESEQRQLDLRLLQSDVANLPPEAVSQLTQAHHTLSRDSQSTPTVLLNWLRGKSTPKVVHM